MDNATKNDIINEVAKRTGERKETAAKMVNETFTVLRELICSTDSEIRVGIRDFGTFEVKKTSATQARNPRTNEKIDIQPRKRVHFIPGIYMKEILRRPL